MPNFQFSLSGGTITDSELGYAEIVALSTFHGTTATAVTGLSLTVTPRARPFMLRCYLPQVLNQSSATGFNLFLTITDTASGTPVQATQIFTSNAVANGRIPILAEGRISTCTPGVPYTYQVNVNTNAAGSSFAIDSTASSTHRIASFIQAVEV